jgi:hypothetical protein
MSQLTGDAYLDRPFRPCAERILAQVWGCPVRIDEGMTIGSADEIKPNVRRCAVLTGPANGPATVIVKRILGPGAYDPDDLRRITEFDGMPTRAWQLCHEWAGAAFLSALPADPPLSPRCYGGDRSEGLVVLEDIGTGPKLGELLEASDPSRAEQAALGYAMALGRMHAATIGRQAEFLKVWTSLGFPGLAPDPPDVRGPWRRFREVAQAHDLRLPTAFDEEAEAIAASIEAPGPFLAFGHGENNPINSMLVASEGSGTAERIRLFDFEFSGFRHALMDGVNFRHLFPWRAYRLPDAHLRRIEAAYRAELSWGCPEASDDAIYGREFAAARAHWTICTVGGHLSGAIGGDSALQEDGYWEGELTEAERAIKPTVRQRVLILLETLAETADEFGQLPSVGAAARTMAGGLRAHWQPAEFELPIYPAFRAV